MRGRPHTRCAFLISDERTTMLQVEQESSVWANWLIYAVRYDAPHRHINWLFAYSDHGDSVCRKEIFSRQTVIDVIERGATFCTIHKNPTGAWDFGSMLRVVDIDGEKFLTTGPAPGDDDSLGVPEL